MYKILMNISDYTDNIPGLISLLGGILLAAAVTVLVINPLHNYIKYSIAYKCGDKSFIGDGLYSMSPRNHFHVIGFVTTLLLNISFAQPAYYDDDNFRHPKRTTILISLSGILSYFGCFLVAGVLYNILRLCGFFSLAVASQIPVQAQWYVYVYHAFFAATYYIFRICICSLIFNLIPFGALDMADVLYMFLPVNWTDVLRNNEALVSLVLFIAAFLTVGSPDGLINSWGISVMNRTSELINSFLSLFIG